MRLVHSFLRDLIFYNCSSCSCPFSPVVAAVVSATATSPLKLAATGVPFSKMSGALLVSHGVTDGVSGTDSVPRAHNLRERSIVSSRGEEALQWVAASAKTSAANAVDARASRRCSLGCAASLLASLCSRGSCATIPPPATRRALLAYLLKQFLELILEIFPRKLMKRIL